MVVLAEILLDLNVLKSYNVLTKSQSACKVRKTERDREMEKERERESL